MTEAEWLACNEPEAILRFASRYTSRRKEQLFAVACCQRIGAFLDDCCLALLARVEVAADHPLSVAAMEELINDAMAHADGLSYHMGTPIGSARWQAANAVWFAAEGNTASAANEAADAVTTSKCDPETFDVNRPGVPVVGDPLELVAQADLLRHITGNPFRPAVADPAWRTDTAVSLARGMYESREFGAMPILADALQDAGCDNDDVLNHCRADAVHVRGCWVVDLVLGKC